MSESVNPYTERLRGELVAYRNIETGLCILWNEYNIHNHDFEDKTGMLIGELSHTVLNKIDELEEQIKKDEFSFTKSILF